MAGKTGSIARVTVVIVLSGLLALPGRAFAAELETETLAAFNRYVALTESPMDPGISGQNDFLWVDRMTPNQRTAALARLRAGEVVIEQLKTLDHGKTIDVPNGMIHHWIGTVFIPGVTLSETLAFLQDYDHQQEYFQPDVIHSKILRHEGNDYDVLLRLRKQKIVTVILDTEHEIHYQNAGAKRALSRSHTTRIQQVENAGKNNEFSRPAGQDDGYLWSMITYWRFEEKDGGTYVESQSISLTRNIPAGLGWLVGPFVTSIPRESLTFTLSTTRRTLLGRSGSHRAP